MFDRLNYYFYGNVTNLIEAVDSWKNDYVIANI